MGKGCKMPKSGRVWSMKPDMESQRLLQPLLLLIKLTNWTAALQRSSACVSPSNWKIAGMWLGNFGANFIQPDLAPCYFICLDPWRSSSSASSMTLTSNWNRPIEGGSSRSLLSTNWCIIGADASLGKMPQHAAMLEINKWVIHSFLFPIVINRFFFLFFSLYALLIDSPSCIRLIHSDNSFDFWKSYVFFFCLMITYYIPYIV